VNAPRFLRTYRAAWLGGDIFIASSSFAAKTDAGVAAPARQVLPVERCLVLEDSPRAPRTPSNGRWIKRSFGGSPEHEACGRPVRNRCSIRIARSGPAMGTVHLPERLFGSMNAA
jgi:hypothetical protein